MRLAASYFYYGLITKLQGKVNMKPVAVFTLNELQQLVPSFVKEAVTSENQKVKEAVHAMFWRLGCDCTTGIEVQEGCVSKNKFGEMDDSPRFIVSERTDTAWLMSGHASTAAKQYTPDVGLVVDLWKLKNIGI